MTDTPLHDAVADLDAAIQRLFGPRQDTSGAWTASVWAQMVEAIHDKPSGGNRGVFTTGAVANLTALDWVREIEMVTSHLTKLRDTPQIILESLAHVTAWGPEQTDSVLQIAATVHGWARKGESILWPESVMEIPKVACPECDTSVVYRPNQYGETCRKAALQVTTTECVCLNCKASWPAAHFELLAATLGCDPVETKIA